ncbi:putative baseplate assembly protein [Vibrio phage 501E54-1]|nr:putative baseplate assembly protein [Vibrio phage 501E54-1]
MSRTYDMITNSLTEHTNSRTEELKQNIYKSIPAMIIGVDDYEKHQCVSVEFLIRDIFNKKDATILEAVRLEKVFVRLPKFGGWKFKYPIQKGNEVVLHWSHKDLSKFLDGDGSSVSQSITEVGELEDCFVELGFGTRKNHNNPSLHNLILTQKATTITITPEGHISLTTDGDISTIAKGSHFLKSSHLTIDNSVTINENLSVGGTTTSTGVVTARSGVHASTYAGLGGGAANFAVDIGINGTVTINGVVVNTHTHTNPEGGDVGVMK